MHHARQKKPSLSVLIEGRNRAGDLVECIENVRPIADEIVYIDTGSSDDSIQKAKKHNARVFHFGAYSFVEPARFKGIQRCTKDWIVILDLDERLSDELIKVLPTYIAHTTKSAFFVYRKNYFARSQWIRHGGWWPDKVPRLMKKSAVNDWPSDIHASPVISGDYGEIREPIIHFWKDSISDMVIASTTFEEKEAELYYHAHKTMSRISVIKKSSMSFLKRFVLLKGYKDGVIGLVLALYQAYAAVIMYLFWYEKNKKSINY